MEQDSTQAVTPTSTTPEPSVKRLQKGDAREDGKIFWKYDPSYANGERWMTPEKFAAEKTKEAEKRAALSTKKASLPTKLRRGDIGEDGRIFWSYAPGRVNDEYWMTSDRFAAEKTKETTRRRKRDAKLSAKRAASLNKRCYGDVREDGMIFWCYKSSCVGGEYWKTPEQFASDQNKANTKSRERRATDPLYALKRRLRCRIRASFRNRGFRKNSKTATMLGCTYEEFRAHIERLFLPGMSWANFSGCHIDHVVPLNAAKTEEDVYVLNHYTNLRPLWGPENIAKSDTLPEEHELPADLHPKVREIWLTATYSSLEN